MGTYAAYQTDEKLEREGAVVDLGERGAFLIARAGGKNTKYTKLVRKLMRPHKREALALTLDIDIADRIAIDAFSQMIVLGWFKKGDPFPSTDPDAEPVLCEYDVTGPNGYPLPFSPANAKKLLTDLPDLFADLRSFADDATTYQREVLEAEGKSLPPSSPTG